MNYLTALSVASLLLISGCRTYEISAVPPGHPASIDAASAPHQRSTTLEPTTPVDPQGRASDQFGHQPADNHGHAGHGASSAHGGESPPADPTPRRPPQVCPVSGQKLGSMGKPVVVEHGGRYLMLCCAGCVDAFKQDPKRYLNPAKHSEADPATNEDAPARPQADPKPQTDHHDH